MTVADWNNESWQPLVYLAFYGSFYFHVPTLHQLLTEIEHSPRLVYYMAWILRSLYIIKPVNFLGLFTPNPGKVSGMKPTILSDVELKNIRNLIIRHPLLHKGKKIKNSIHKMQFKPTIFLERLNLWPSFAPWMHAQVCAVVIITYNTSWMVLGKKSHTTKASPHSWQLNASRF